MTAFYSVVLDSIVCNMQDPYYVDYVALGDVLARLLVIFFCSNLTLLVARCCLHTACLNWKLEKL